MESFGKILVIIGLVLVVAGAIIWLGGHRFEWFGNLPGDIKIRRNNVTIYAPIVTFLLISLLLTLLVNIIRRFL